MLRRKRGVFQEERHVSSQNHGAYLPALFDPYLPTLFLSHQGTTLLNVYGIWQGLLSWTAIWNGTI